MKELKTINFENVSAEESLDYRIRLAARAVVVDGDNNVAILHSTVNNYYKLPGGGLEGDEDKGEALKRECLEEIGCDVEVVVEVGSITEYRREIKLKSTSYCYFAKLKGERGIPQLEQDEIRDGFVTLWLPFDVALDRIKNSDVSSMYGLVHMVERDSAFLEESSGYLNQK